MSPASYQTAPPRVAMESGKRDSNPRPRECHSRALPTELRPRYIGPRKTRSGGNTASYLDVVAVSSVFAPVRELFGLCLVTQGDPGLIDMPKHIRRKKTTSPARAKPRAAARARAEGARRRPGVDAGAGEAQPALRDLGRQEVSEPWPAPHRPDRRGERRAAHGGPEVRPGPGREVHLVRRVVDPPGDPRRVGAP